MNIKPLLLLIALIALPGLAAPPLSTPAAGQREQQRFITQAATAAGEQTARGIAHFIDSNLTVRWFAQRLMRDYAHIDSSLGTFAHANGMQLPERAMRNMSAGTSFANDALWLQEVIASQRQVIATFEREAETTRDARLRAFANSMLPLLRRDLQEAKVVFSRVVPRAMVFSGQPKRLRIPLSDRHQDRA